MNSLGPDARSLIDAAREGDDPTSEDAARVGARVRTRIGLSVGALAATSLASKGAGASAAPLGIFSAFTAKCIVGAAVLGSVATASTYAIHAARREPAAATQAASRPSALPRATTIAVTQPTAIAIVEQTAPKSETSEIPPSPSPKAIVAKRRTVVSATSPAKVRANANTESDSLAAETALVRDAQDAFARGDQTRALAALSDHATRFPYSVLGEEREATRVHILCSQGRVQDAQTAARAFVAAHPNSALLPAVRQSCAERP